METRKRSLVKALVWSAIGLAVMSFIGWVATGSVAVGGIMALVNTAIGLVMYVLYERIWASISWVAMSKLIAGFEDLTVNLILICNGA